MVAMLENLVFRWRREILIGFALITLVTGFFAFQLRMTAGFDKQLPSNHPYVETFQEYRDRLFGSNRIIIVLRNREGTIWNKAFLTKLQAATDDVFFLPGVDRRTVTSLWTPNTRYFEITEEGFRADDVISGTITPETMTREDVTRIENNVIRGGYVGRLVSRDFTSAMIMAELLEVDPRTGEPLDYFALADALEAKIREAHEDADTEIHIVGFAKLIGDIADGAGSVVKFFAIAFLVTAVLVFWYSRSLKLTVLPLLCSLTSLIWQFGLLKILGYGLDPLAILVPFLVFAIGVSHGVQQINLISREVEAGATPEQAARASFSALLVPGSMALVTDLVGFGTLIFIAIPMIQELAITASIGVALKIITNLVMLPLVASYCTVADGYVEKITDARAVRTRIMGGLARLAEPRNAVIVFSITMVLLLVGIWQSHGRHIGDLHAGAPELRPTARYNVDSRVISESYDVGLNLLTVVIETPSEACIKYDYMRFIDDFGWAMENVPGVLSVISVATVARETNAGWNEGNPKWQTVPRNPFSLVQATSPIPTGSGLLNADCSVLPLMIFTEDAKAQTLTRVVDAVKTWRAANGFTPVLNRGQDNRDGTWSLTLEDLRHLTFTTPPGLKGEAVLGITLMGEDGTVLLNDGDLEEASGGEVAVAFDTPPEGETVAVDLRDRLPDLPWDSAETVILSGVPESTTIRLASGNVGIIAATNEEIRDAELPMLLAVYMVIILMVFGTYRDWRATIACCLPLTVATFLGYWFMKELSIGLKVATLPVMVLAVGLGVDYAFYIYNRMQHYLEQGLTIAQSYRQTMEETGVAVVFVGLTMAVGVSTWTFSALKFQADMGMLLFFMFMMNMIMAITALPALAVVLDMVAPRAAQGRSVRLTETPEPIT